jgi:hypothetical protein
MASADQINFLFKDCAAHESRYLAAKGHRETETPHDGGTRAYHVIFTYIQMLESGPRPLMLA